MENVPLAHLSRTSSELADVGGLKFYDVDGDLTSVVEFDHATLWLVDLPDGREGTTVMAPESGIDEDSALNELVAFLGGDVATIEWRRGVN
ncbi:MAG: hypothetical protein M3N57_06955 [Actinomycetota bacterium]|nr:hypothetical protein [Actinomycetota bacterium]